MLVLCISDPVNRIFSERCVVLATPVASAMPLAAAPASSATVCARSAVVVLRSLTIHPARVFLLQMQVVDVGGMAARPVLATPVEADAMASATSPTACASVRQ